MDEAVTMPSFYKLMIQLNVALYRISRGLIGGQIMLLLTTTGRKSGIARTTPLRYLRDGENYLIVASNWGNEKPPAWFYNLQANPNVSLEVKGKHLAARAEITSGDERDALYQRFVAADASFTRYQAGVERTIPVIRLHPVQD